MNYNQNEQRKAGVRLPGMPGEGLVKEFKNDPNSADFFSARAYITFQVTKSIQLQFGHDKNIIGNGSSVDDSVGQCRSLFIFEAKYYNRSISVPKSYLHNWFTQASNQTTKFFRENT